MELIEAFRMGDLVSHESMTRFEYEYVEWKEEKASVKGVYKPASFEGRK